MRKMKSDGTQINCYTNLRKLCPFLQPTSRKFRDYMYCRQTRNIQPVLFQTVNQDVCKGVLEHLHENIWCCRPKLRAAGKCSGYMTTRGCVQHYPSKNFCQHIKSLYCCVHHILQICHLAIFSYFHDWNEYWKGFDLTFRAFRRPWQNSSAGFQQVLARTTSKISTNAGSGILMKEEAFQRRSLAPECKNNINIFISLALELYTHRLYLDHARNAKVRWCCIRITNHWSSCSNSKGIKCHLTQLMYIIHIIMATCFDAVCSYSGQ